MKLGLALSLVLGFFALATIQTPGPAHAAASTPHRQITDPFALYGDEFVFGVYRNGDRVGSHRVSFRRQDGDIIVDVYFTVDIRFLFLSAYRYVYVATERWRGGQLVALEAETNDNGDVSRVVAKVTEEGDQLLVTGPSGTTFADLGIYATNHWHPGIITSEVVLNTITGGLNRVSIIDGGEMQITANGSPISARRYLYTGELSNEVWYDREGRWVKMRFDGKDGSTIEYTLEQMGDGGAERS